MNRTIVLEALVATLAEVQSLMGQPCPPLTGATVPIDDLPKFDSKIWPVALGMVGEKLSVEVPVDVNVFRQEKTKTPYNIEQTVTAILKAIQKKSDPATPIEPSTRSQPTHAEEHA